ncbi:MAG: prolipoprotein diacylglyceryl transferase [Gammaproteobacteria bacterium]
MSIAYPEFDPILVSLGPIDIHWYGIMYLIGFSLAWFLALWRVKHFHLKWTSDQVGDLIFFAALGTILGGRIGYMLFYGMSELVLNPLNLFKIWEGGMSFHGGLLGVIAALYYFAKSRHKPFFAVTDFVAPLVPLGLAAGRIGNFINGELWGRPTNVPWAMVFPDADAFPRHPSQLYECGLEGFLLFGILWWYVSKPRPQGRPSAVFLMGYALCRFTAEFFRQPDIQIGYIALDWVTMGQLLSIPMFVGGLFLYYYSREHHGHLS